jgi:hypothetical protein
VTELLRAQDDLKSRNFVRFEVCVDRGTFETSISRWKRSAGKDHRTDESFKIAVRHIGTSVDALKRVNNTAQRLASGNGDRGHA